ncbi:MAG: phosphoserine phosphatase [Paraglaciecola sp.]
MFPVPISPKQLLSGLYLQHLVDQDQFDAFSFTQGDLLVLNKVAGAQTRCAPESGVKPKHSTLLMFAEGLNLHKIMLVEQALGKQLRIANFRVLRMRGMTGFAIAASVERLTDRDLRETLEVIANTHTVELCLFDTVPTLTEPGLLLMDMDSTVIAVECIDQIALLAGVGEQVSRVTGLAMEGKLDFAQSLISRVACLAGADESILAQVKNALPLMPGIFNLVRLLKQHRWKLAIASGGFTYFADYLADRLELDAAVANRLAIVDGKLQGSVAGDIVDAQVKANTLEALAEKWSIPHSQTIAMGDGANDLVMMNAAALGVAFHAKAIVRNQADIAIRTGDLDTLLWVLVASA